MKLILPAFLILILITSCCPEPKEITAEDLKREQEAVVNVNRAYNKASEEKNFSSMVETLAGEVIFFGTDSAEIIRTFSDFKKQMLKQWEYYEKMQYGELTDVSIQMDQNATFASIIFGVPVDLTRMGKMERHFLRVSRTLKKEKNKWVIVSGIVSIARSADLTQDQPSAENTKPE